MYCINGKKMSPLFRKKEIGKWLMNLNKIKIKLWKDLKNQVAKQLKSRRSNK